MTDLLGYLNRLTPKRFKIAPARSDTKPYPGGGDSPYKPILLFVVLQSIQNRDRAFCRGIIEFDKCRDRFSSLYKAIYSEVEIPDLESKVVQPFWYFGAGVPRIWDFVAQHEMTVPLKNAIAKGTQIKTLPKLQNLVAMAEINSNDLDLLNNEVAATAIRSYLISTYFMGMESQVASAVASLK